MFYGILARIKRKIHHLTIKRFDDYIEMKSSTYGDICLYSGHYRIRHRNRYGERKEQDLLRFIDSLDNNSTMWDVGANIGYFSLYAAKRGVRVLAFEPDQMTAGIINKNIYLNGLSDKVLNIPIALNDETKISVFHMRNFLPANAYNTFDRHTNQWGKDFSPEFQQGAIGMRGDDIVLDITLTKFSKPDFIKIDVDGNEYKVLKGMRTRLQHARYLCVELSYRHPEFEKVQKLLSDLGYREIKDDCYLDIEREKNGMRNFYYERTTK